MVDEETQQVEEPEEVGGLISKEEAIEIAEEQGGSREELEAAETSEPRQPSDELKVVLTVKGTRAIVGIQSPDCDPIFTTVEGDLAAVLSQVPALVEAANAKWDANPRYPKAELPEPPPSAAPARIAPAPAPSKPKQPSFF